MPFIFPTGRNSTHNEIAARLASIKQGDSYDRDKFISDYTPFILKTVSQITGKYVDSSNSDEFGIALLAFNEAIDCFDIKKGGAFIPFAKMVIKRRIIDFNRKNNRADTEISLSQLDEEGAETDKKFVTADNYTQTEVLDRKLEIDRFKQILQQFAISINDLVNTCPKHRDTRQLCVQIAKKIINNDEFKTALFNNKIITVKALSKQCNVSEKTIERHRKYIIAVCIILDGDFDCIKQYINEAWSV